MISHFLLENPSEHLEDVAYGIRTYSASIQTNESINESIKINFLSRGYFNPPTIFSSSI